MILEGYGAKVALGTREGMIVFYRFLPIQEVCLLTDIEKAFLKKVSPMPIRITVIVLLFS